jgi:phosphatidylserine/phosphatidylglycerophosphate/cardiolipin synthase-like enzyme
VWKERGSMHNKFAIIDGKSVATGSFNYSANANERNDENLVFLHGEKIVLEFQKEFEEIWQSN